MVPWVTAAITSLLCRRAYDFRRDRFCVENQGIFLYSDERRDGRGRCHRACRFRAIFFVE